MEDNFIKDRQREIWDPEAQGHVCEKGLRLKVNLQAQSIKDDIVTKAESQRIVVYSIFPKK